MTCATEGCRGPRQPGRDYCASCLSEQIETAPRLETRDAAFKRMWNAGATGGEIAEELGYRDRKAVYRTSKRLGLEPRKKHVRQ